MKVVSAIDSLKGSLTSIQAGNAAKEGILSVYPQADVVVKPLADGGEGTTDALIEGLGAKKVELTVTGPLGMPVNAYYGVLEETNTVVMEMASAAGITLLTESQKNPYLATTYGVGEMIRDAVSKGYRDFIVGIGGSATNDGGIGMLSALGFRFLNARKSPVKQGAQALKSVSSIDFSEKMPELADCRFRVACDVTNPLCGENGATYVFGPQKGVSETDKASLDCAMRHYADVAQHAIGKDFSCCEGAGAAGGLGFAFLSFLNASLTPGIELILDAIHLEDDIKDADIVLTGEGRIDYQTAMGKAPIGVAKLAKKYGAKVIAFAGSVTLDASACNHAGIDAFFPIVRGVTTLEEAMDPQNAYTNMRAAVEQVFRLL